MFSNGLQKSLDSSTLRNYYNKGLREGNHYHDEV